MPTPPSLILWPWMRVVNHVADETHISLYLYFILLSINTNSLPTANASTEPKTARFRNRCIATMAPAPANYQNPSGVNRIVEHGVYYNDGKYRCTREANGKECGSVMTGSKHSISSHNSIKHSNGAYHKANTDGPYNCVHCGTEAVTLNALVGHYRRKHGKTARDTIKELHGIPVEKPSKGAAAKRERAEQIPFAGQMLGQGFAMPAGYQSVPQYYTPEQDHIAAMNVGHPGAAATQDGTMMYHAQPMDMRSSYDDTNVGMTGSSMEHPHNSYPDQGIENLAMVNAILQTLPEANTQGGPMVPMDYPGNMAPAPNPGNLYGPYAAQNMPYDPIDPRIIQNPHLPMSFDIPCNAQAGGKGLVAEYGDTPADTQGNEEEFGAGGGGGVPNDFMG
ncbi:hypothetical protein GGR50DRAFT_145346 [Xylaria sp. CBS 124048]|nr:hypothetical protein GGR50DRAFT_145346 [Xylaria sp. CBS 124048]